MEAQREYLRKKQAEGESGTDAMDSEDSKMKAKVAKLIRG